MDAVVKVACIQAEPVVLNREAAIDRLEALTAEAAAAGAEGAGIDPALLWAERRRFDPAGHSHRPDVLGLRVTPLER
ncbi:MAG TPA: hypothetical protein VH063_19370 [Gaiellaceae bacterium]|jgi:predicted amidohydrolase|nr:hypothetical protein [Gaiellaceae bacterium]